jgi:aryl-alcohol dehydrogenase-like predicted oxidoreductase
MERIKLGRTDLNVSPICFGCWQMGQSYWGKVPETDLKEAVQRAIELGVNFFDNADAYVDGLAEEILGRALQGTKRVDLVIATKVFHHWHEDQDHWRHGDLSHDYIIWECEQSLKRLKTDYIDLYQAHSSDPLAHPEETARAFEELKKSGKVRWTGCSNYSVEQLRTALQFGHIDTLQPRYNLFQTDIEKDLLPLCLANNIGVLVYSPLCHGLLTGKYTGEETFTDLRENNSMFQDEEFRKNVEKVNKVKEIAKGLGKSVVQTILAATVAHPAVHCAIAGIKRPEQIEDAAGAMGLKIDRQTYYKIRQAIGS